MKKLEIIILFLIILSSSVWATTYTATKPKDLDITTPTESNTKISEFNNSDREIKTVITNLENITTITGTYTAAGTQTGILGSNTSAFTISFPAASTLATNAIMKRYMIKNISSGTITLNLTVDGVGSPTVAGSQTFKLFTDGTSWFEDRVGRAAIASNADLLDNLDSTYFTNATNLATGTVALIRIPGTLTGKSADLLDEQTGSYYTNASNLDSGTIPLDRIPTTLTGKDADTIDGINGASIVQISRTISTTAPLAGGSDLSANLTLSMPLATSGQNGYISSADWSIFNNKLSSSRTITTTSPLTIDGVASADLSANRTIAMAIATASQDGYIKKEDFQMLSNKANVVAGSGITSSSSTGTTTITNNGVLQILPGAGISISGNGTGTPTITAVGTSSAGGWLDTGTATVATLGYAIIPQGTITVNAAYGITGLTDAWIPNTITLDNFTQITNRNYNDVSGTTTIAPTTAIVTNLTATVGTITTLYGNGSNLTNVILASLTQVTTRNFADMQGIISLATQTSGIPHTRVGTTIYPGTITDSIVYGTTTPVAATKMTIHGSFTNSLAILNNKINPYGGSNTTALMTSYIAPAPNAVLDKDHVVGREGYYAFDRTQGEAFRWLDNSTIYPTWVEYNFGTGTSWPIYEYNISCHEPTFAPKDFALQGSTDKITWVGINSQSNITIWTANTYKNFTIATSTTAYQFYRVLIGSNNGGTSAEIGELQLLNGAIMNVTNTAMNIIGSGTVLIGTNTPTNADYVHEIIGNAYISRKQVIGTTTTATMAYGSASVLVSADNSTAESIVIPVPQANITTADVFQEYRSSSGIEGSVAGTGVAGVLAFNTFTGSHFTWVKDKDGLQILDVLEIAGGNLGSWEKDEFEWKTVEEVARDSTGKIIWDTIGTTTAKIQRVKKVNKKVLVQKTLRGIAPKSHLVGSQRCATRRSQAVYGLYGGVGKEGQDLVLAIGASPIKIINTGKNIKIGDYLMSSDFPGFAELQVTEQENLNKLISGTWLDGTSTPRLITWYGGQQYNHTLAKACEEIIWDVGEQWRQIACLLVGD